jgi:hypothetical protein
MSESNPAPNSTPAYPADAPAAPPRDTETVTPQLPTLPAPDPLLLDGEFKSLTDARAEERGR